MPAMILLKSQPDNPNVKYKMAFSQQLAQLPPEVSAKVRFANAHPETIKDPKLLNLVATLRAEAEAETESSYGLSSWEAPEPDAKKLDQQITQNLHRNFKSLVKGNPDAKVLTLAHFHPELSDTLSPEQQKQLNQFEKEAYQETQGQEGFPDGWQPPTDSSPFDNGVTSHYDQAFNEELLQQKGFTPKERRALKTLHHFPKAKVPGREKLESTLKELNAKANQRTKERFGLPKNFKVASQSDVYKATLMGGFKHNFTKQVQAKLNKGEISQEQAQKLLNSKGMDPSKIPSNLQAIYSQVRQSASKATSEQFQLPEKWQPSSSEGETQGSSSGEATVRNADGTVRIRANTAISSGGEGGSGGEPDDLTAENTKTAGTSAAGATSSTDLTANINAAANLALTPFPGEQLYRDLTTAGSAIDYYKQATGVAGNLFSKYLTGSGQMTMGDAMMAVSSALDGLRDFVYAQETALVKVQQTMAQAETSVSLGEIQKEQQEQAAANQQPQENDFYKFLDWLGKTLHLTGLTNIIKGAFELLAWAVNVITGGAISMINQAAGTAPAYENPLEMLGWINSDQAQTCDFALGIVMMVVEMAASVVVAQPELVLGEIAEMSVEATEFAAETATTIAEAGADAGVEAAGQGVQAGLDAMVSSMSDASDALDASTESAEDVTSDVADATTQSVKTSSKAEEAAQTTEEEIAQNYQSLAKDVDVVETSAEGSVEEASAALRIFKTIGKELLNLVGVGGIEDIVDATQIVGKGIEKQILQTTIKQAVKSGVEKIGEKIIDKGVSQAMSKGKQGAEDVAGEVGEEAEVGATSAAGAKKITQVIKQIVKNNPNFKKEIQELAEQAEKDAQDSAAGAAAKGAKAAAKDAKDASKASTKAADDTSEVADVTTEQAAKAGGSKSKTVTLFKKGMMTVDEEEPEEKLAETAAKNASKTKGKAKELTKTEKAKLQEAVTNAGKKARLKQLREVARNEKSFNEFKSKSIENIKKELTKTEEDLKQAESSVQKTMLKDKMDKLNSSLEEFNKLTQKEYKAKIDKLFQKLKTPIPSLKDYVKAATKGLTGLHKAHEGWEAVKGWIGKQVLQGLKKAAKATKLTKLGKKIETKMGESKVGRALLDAGTEVIARTMGGSETHLGSALDRDLADAEDETRLQRRLEKASKHIIRERETAQFQFMMDIKDYLQDAIQFASDTAQGMMLMKQADTVEQQAEFQAWVEEIDTYLAMIKKAEDATLKSLQDCAGWINDINQQESGYWKKMSIRYIAA